MEKIKVYFFLLFFLWIQFGSTGFTFYVNSCSASGHTSVTSNQLGCRCTSEMDEWNKHESNEEHLTKKCCCSREHFAQTADDYPTSSFEVDESSLDVFIASSQFVELQDHFIQNSVLENYSSNSPPIRNIDTRIFIQSFQI